jgi:hypothetical protein|tara:strand:- start:174 stop:386 length:213 start_codon:yes stop_codon:yes gene_type:complete
MNTLYFIIYFTCFALIAGSAFAMMWANINAVWRQPTVVKRTHPEAPAAGEEVMYVDLKRERLEKLLNDSE